MALVETLSSAWVPSATNVATSGSFTPTANSLLVAVVSNGNGNNATETGTTLTDSVSGTWTRIANEVVATGPLAQVWVKDAGASPAVQSATFTCSPATLIETGIAVRQFTGAAVAASQTGVTAISGTTPYTLAITPGTTGSQVVGAFGRSSTSVTLTANGSTTIYGQSIGGGGTIAAMEANALSAAGTPITVGFTNAAGGSNAIALAEILPAVVTAHTYGSMMAFPF